MIAFPSLLIMPAIKAGISVPENIENFDREAYPHWAVFCGAQIGAAMPYATAHWDNAKVIASIPMEEIRQVTLEQLQERGIALGCPIP